MQNFKGYVDVGGLGKQPVWRRKVSFSFFRYAHMSIFGHTPTHNTPLYVVLANEISLRKKDEILHLIHFTLQKT